MVKACDLVLPQRGYTQCRQLSYWSVWGYSLRVLYFPSVFNVTQHIHLWGFFASKFEAFSSCFLLPKATLFVCVCLCECVSYSGCWADGWWQTACCSSHTPARCRCPRGVPLGRGDGARCSSSPAAWRGLTPTQTVGKHGEQAHSFRHWYDTDPADQRLANCVHGDIPLYTVPVQLGNAYINIQYNRDFDKSLDLCDFKDHNITI